MKIEVKVSHIYSSPEHNYFTRKKFDIGNAVTFEHDYVELEANKGIRGDRFEFSKYPITFISEEVVEEVCSALEIAYEPRLFRRNIVIRGMNLNQLIGQRFFIGEVEFEGLEHCAPCTWMNAVMKKGAYKLMTGRGGLRVKVRNSGTLYRGENVLLTESLVKTDCIHPLVRLQKPRIP